MTILITRDRSGTMKHTVRLRDHMLLVDESAAVGGEDAGPSPHDLYDASLGACKALTVLWYARRKQMPIEDIQVSVERDDSEERKGVYRLRTVLSVTGSLTDDQRAELLGVAAKCPVHKLMTVVKTEIETELADSGVAVKVQGD